MTQLIQPKCTYIFRLSSLGDLVLCTALVDALAKDSSRKLCFVTYESFAGFVKESFLAPNLELLALPKRGAGGVLRFLLLGYRAARDAIKADIQNEIEVFDLHNVLKSKLWGLGFRLGLVGTKFKVHLKRTKKKGWQRFASVFLGRDLLGPRWVYAEHLRLLSDVALDRPRLLADRATQKNIHVILAPEAQHWKKCWPAMHWESLLTLIFKDTDWQVTLVGGAKSLPQDIIDDAAQRGGQRLKNLLGRTNLAELPRLAATANTVVCGNSAWLHIAEAVGTPALSLAGPIVPGFGFSPWRKESIELSVPALKCRPCTRHGGGICRQPRENFHACMRRLDANLVFATLRGMAENQKNIGPE